ncbi:MAG TPA: Nif3-like dinuclear metal center hexameric protein [bacterium]|mgnify:FL=1|nr:Nif3-like dinuclear metal center hexameric protein [bacterium]HQL61101.1 Nif3-like dinuclear metal center hexameric protein [bacterium]
MDPSDLTVRRIADFLDGAIPSACDESRDSGRLQCGDPDRPVKMVWPAYRVTREILRQAERSGVDFMVISRPLPDRWKITENMYSPWPDLLRLLLHTGIAVYAAGSGLNAHPRGLSALLVERLGLSEPHPVLPKPQSGHVKIVTFVPKEYADNVRLAMAQAGAGRIGEYDLCSFHSSGEGSFRGSEQSNPTIGERGKLEFVPEERLEMLCPIPRLADVISALWNAHPYEEPAYDIYELREFRDPRQCLWIGTFEEPLSIEDLVRRAVDAFPELSVPEPIGLLQGRNLRRIACTAGDGSGVISCLVDIEADALICRGIGEEASWKLEECGIPGLSLGRGVLETLFVTAIREILAPLRGEVGVL